MFLQRLKNKLLNLKDGKVSLAQEGEDLILQKIFAKKDNGFYVDVGAHHPRRFSNTQLLYEKGWWGVNIDPTPGSMRLFKKNRKRDINLEIGIAKNSCEQTFYQFSEPALNTFNKQRAEEIEKKGWSPVLRSKAIQVLPLREVLQGINPPNIDLLTIDTEGSELEVLESNDWRCFKPLVILVEMLNLKIEDMPQNIIHQYMTDKNYKLTAKTFSTAVYIQ